MTGPPPPPPRRPTKGNPLVMRRNGVRTSIRKPAPVDAATGNAAPRAPPPPPSAPGPGPVLKSQAEPKDDVEPTGKYRDIPVVLTKKALLDGLRFHALRMNADTPIDITDPEKWPRPVRLHRRDPRARPTHEEEPIPEPVVQTLTPEEEKERDRLEAIKAERKRVREENQAQIAPTQKQQAQAVKTLQFNKKFEPVYLAADTPEAKRRAQIKYEESLPWHLEDDEGKNVWKGTYVSELSKKNAMVVFETGASVGSNQIRLVMLDRWYRFQEKTKFNPLGFDEAETAMSQAVRKPKWAVEAEKKELEKQELEKHGSAFSRVVMVRGGGGNSRKLGSIDDVDYDLGEHFADDDEGADILGHDEAEAKEAGDRIRRGQYSVHGVGEKEEDDDEDEDKEDKAAEALRKLEKSTRKTLANKEHNVNYLFSDDESDPYASSSDNESGPENTQETDAAKDKDAAKPASTQAATQPSAPAGAAAQSSSAGPAKRNGAALKRPGSPTMSESSDLESVRKRVKKNPKGSKAKQSAAPAAAGAEGDESGAKPAASTAVPAGSKKTKGAGAKSPGLPSGAAAAAPSPPAASQSASRAGGGASAAASQNASDSEDAEDFFGDGPVIVTLDKIKEAIPDDGKGISLKRLLKRFRKMDKSTNEFVALLKQVSQFNKTTRRIYPLNPKVSIPT